MLFFDRLSNLLTGLGTGRDKSVGSTYVLNLLTQEQLEAAYRSDWLARKIVDIIPFDMTREWRDWQAEESAIEKIEREEKRLGVRAKVATAKVRARLYGGSAILLGTGDRQPAEPLRIEGVGLGGLAYLHVLSPHELTTGPLVRDPLSPFYGEPEYYEVKSERNPVRVHPSRIVPFYGSVLPDPFSPMTGFVGNGSGGWGDPVLQIVYDAISNAASASQHVAALIPELKSDVISVPGLSEALATPEGTRRVTERFANAAAIRSMHNILLLQGGEEGASEMWQQKQMNFANFPELIRVYLQLAAGAADIPVTRLLGQSPSGLNATGDSDIRNYYDNVAAKQEVELRPTLERIDEVLIRSALGTRPPDVHFRFAPLWQVSEVEKADIDLKRAQATQIYVSSGLVPDDVLAHGVRNQMVEDGPYPGIERAYADHDAGTLEAFIEPIEEPEAVTVP